VIDKTQAWLQCHIRKTSETMGQVTKKKIIKKRKNKREKERQNMTEKKVLEIHDARGLV
jgi:hypothetical protein